MQEALREFYRAFYNIKGIEIVERNYGYMDEHGVIILLWRERRKAKWKRKRK